MAADIVPELYGRIEKDFQREIDKSHSIQRFLKDKKEKKASREDVAAYSADLGSCASLALQKNITEGALPGGKLYWNIAERTILPLLEKVHGMVNDAAIEVDAYIDEKNGIRMKGQRADFPKNRARDLINKMVELFEDDEG